MVVAAGAPELYEKIVRIHMLGEITKGHCSMFGLWGPATKNGETLQMRTLDWDFDGPFRKYAAVIVYHPSDDSQGYPFINIGFTGWLGMLSGINAYNMAISEIGVSYEDPSFGRESRYGNVFTFLMRDLIQYENNL
jgi:isopenicillin-N N-acyltransferase-like protein